jgi:TonB family protein
MKIYIISIILFLFGTFNISSQTQLNKDTCNCPSQYTHSEILNSSIKIGKVVVLDSTKYSTLPSTINNLDSLSSLILYPEIAKRAIVFGEVKYLLSITSEGKVKEIKLIKGLGAGLDEASLDILKELNFNPAQTKNIAVESEVNIAVNFNVHKTIDEPDIVLDEIKYESVGRTEYFKTTMVFKKDSSAYFERRNADEIEEAVGKINLFKYSKLSDFILSQCFFNLKEIYKGRTTDAGTAIITVKHNNITKSVTSTGGEFYPISFWAIANLIKFFKSEIKWEIIKYESGIKKLPEQNDDE